MIEKISSEEAKSILKRHLGFTYGVIVYEEQILMILRDLGNFEPRELNRLRKVIHDKLGSTAFNEYYLQFIKGCATHGVSENESQFIWNAMVGASGYAFNIAHSVCYAVIGYWTQYLKSRYPVEFYTSLLIKCPDSPEGLVRRAKIVAAALRNGIQVGPPDLMNSQEDWTICPEDPSGVGPRIVAGFNSIRGIGAKRCEKILTWREEIKALNKGRNSIVESQLSDFDWDDLIEVKGFGPKTIETIKEFVSNEDPFGVYKTAKVLNEARNAIKNGELPGLPSPTHVSVDIPTDFGSYVTFIGIVRERKYYDAVEQLQKRTAGNLEYEEALNQLKDKHLLKYVALYCEDEYGEQVVVRVSRWKYPEYAYAISRIKVNRDMVLAEGKSSDFSGISIQAKRLEILEP